MVWVQCMYLSSLSDVFFLIVTQCLCLDKAPFKILSLQDDFGFGMSMLEANNMRKSHTALSLPISYTFGRL